MEIQRNPFTQIDPELAQRQRRQAWWMVATAGAAAVCCGIAALLAGSWILAVAAGLFLAYAIRVGVFRYNDEQDRRRFDGLGEKAVSLAGLDDYESVMQLGRSILDGAATDHYAHWGLEWAAYAAIQSGNVEEMQLLLDEAVRRGCEPHIPAQLFAALGDYESAVGYWEIAVVEPGGEASVPGLVYSLAAVGEIERAQRVIERACESHPTHELIEWQVWSRLETDDVDEAISIIESGAIPEPSPWGLSLCQVATMRAGRHEDSLQFGERVLASGLEDKALLDTARYNRACSHAQLGNIDAALAEFGEVADTGVLAFAAEDPDLDPLRSQPAFREILGDSGAPQ